MKVDVLTTDGLLTWRSVFSPDDCREPIAAKPWKAVYFCNDVKDANKAMPLKQLTPTSIFQHEEPSDRSLTDRDLKILWISRTLTNIDSQCCEDILNLELSNMEADRKKYIRDQLVLKYRERCAPYQELLETLKG